MGEVSGSMSIAFQSDEVMQAISDFSELALSQAEARMRLEQKNKALFDNWLGVAGDNFRLASGNIEKRLGNIVTRQDNAAKVLDELAAGFNELGGEVQSAVSTEG